MKVPFFSRAGIVRAFQRDTRAIEPGIGVGGWGGIDSQIWTF